MVDKCEGFKEERACQINDIKKKMAASKDEIAKSAGENIVSGTIHTMRHFGEFSFLILRTRQGLIQCYIEKNRFADLFDELVDNACVELTGTIKEEERAPNNFEFIIDDIKILSQPYQQTPVSLSKWKLGVSLDKNLELRPLTLRHLHQRAIFKIQEGIVRGFRDFLQKEEFTEIRTPKIVSAGAEGGSNIFQLDYFGRKAYLAQSPQFYKQTMVGVYERVFEVGPVFRAEKHNTTRHLNEYTSLDFEMGFITDFSDIMNMEVSALKYIFDLLKNEYQNEINMLKIKMPEFDSIPAVRFDTAKEMVSKKYNRKIKDPYDLEPEEENLIGQLFMDEFDSEFVFVTHYPTKKRPFYAMDDPENTKFTLSFDLLFRGMEITTGGQRIHQYEEQVEKMLKKGMNPDDFESYLMIHKYGMPPHGGLGLGLERLTMKLLGETNIRTTTMFPRDQTRLDP
ncbi:MAG: aspartate--tRNA(Asn) ligase [Saccharofermentanales bacterium]